MAQWTETKVGRILARSRMFSPMLCVLPRCNWAGDEADLLVLTRTCKLVDVEIKISRPDFRADKKKSKWYTHQRGWFVDGVWQQRPPIKREWPRRIWKHFYAIPAEVWRDDLLEHAQPNSGILLISEPEYGDQGVRVLRQAVYNSEAKPLLPEEVMQIARLATLRLWDAYKRLEAHER